MAHNHGEVVRFSQSARKHRVGSARALHVIANAQPLRVTPVGKHARLLWVARDDRGLELEVVAIRMPEYLLVIHVMPTALRREGGSTP